jgi:hypothetical protein
MAIEPPSSPIETKKQNIGIDGTPNGVFSLENILGENHEFIEHPGCNGEITGWDEEIPEKAAVEGYCVECEGQSLCVAWVNIFLTPSNTMQTSQHRCFAKLAQIITAKFASLHSTGRAQGSDMPQSLCLTMWTRPLKLRTESTEI